VRNCHKIGYVCISTSHLFTCAEGICEAIFYLALTNNEQGACWRASIYKYITVLYAVSTLLFERIICYSFVTLK